MVVTKLTNGFGNNLFQIVYGKLLAHRLNTDFEILSFGSDYYALPALREVFACELNEFNGSLEGFESVSDSSPLSLNPNSSYLLRGHFEDYNLFLKDRDVIRSWFTIPDSRPPTDLVLHLRLGDRLFYDNHYGTQMLGSPKQYAEALDKFDFDNLFIVTDFPFWGEISIGELETVKTHTPVIKEQSVMNKAQKYFNEIYCFFDSFSPIVRNDKPIGKDFNFIRSFSNILFMHGTLSWWAAFISDASHVGVYGPWRPSKGSSNKNLSLINLPGWFKWA